MPRFLFWNLQGKDLRQLVAQIAFEHRVDIVILAESSIPEASMLECFNTATSIYELAPTRLCRAVTFYTGFNASFLTPVLESHRVSIRRLALPARDEILVVGAHLPSRMHFSEASLSFECTNLAEMIRKQEGLSGHRRTVVLGDLNVNPFELGVVGTTGLHAVMSRAIASKGSRTVQAQEYDFFYNPMWSQFGDRAEGPPGTYYYEKAEHVVYFWNIYDQVLLRPDLLKGFRGSNLRILTSVGSSTLVDADGRPDQTVASDHLPVLMELEF